MRTKLPERRTPVLRGRALASAALVLSLQGCGIVSHQSVYDGVRATQKARTVGTEPQPRELPPDDQYESERQQAIR